ncbi:Protein of unknown function [Octadecabacter temperatus]|uniref:Uncharacterized protein n=1 Tax=Octadecabacter temperatus TaxID=1458307 RepID=A0A0K0Y388_9RHOB|nr:DUF1203 domain-containing protein [Octadecabacter temperatus]AKS45419.1 hypothetical protein OSB_08600 [Octadecabacter temperatus]SIN92508.1 Protein of unknown function [Octadecabacter temperatus]
MRLTFSGLPTTTTRDIKASGSDTYDLPIETHTSDGSASPCRHCFGATPKGEPYLILAHRPFETVNAYTETGPIFLCAADCPAYDAGAVLPDALNSPTYLVRGYSADERIKYGTGSVVNRDSILERAGEILTNDAIAFVDVRSAMNNCWQGRITRAVD